MSNLEMYQMMTTIAKKVGGPTNLLLITAAGGYGIGKGIEWICKAGVKEMKTRQKNNAENGKIHTVKAEYSVCGNGKGNCELKKGDQYRILESDGEAVLIEKIGDVHNPYFVSKSMLEQITD